jgi:hypothetical protein
MILNQIQILTGYKLQIAKDVMGFASNNLIHLIPCCNLLYLSQPR